MEPLLDTVQEVQNLRLDKPLAYKKKAVLLKGPRNKMILVFT